MSRQGPKQGRWAWLAALGRGVLAVFRFVLGNALAAYFKRYWVLLALFGIAVALIFSNVIFDALGTMVYLPALTLGAALSALLLRNVINRDTTDADADSGYTARAWKRLSARDRAIWAKVEILAYFLGACLIASALAGCGEGRENRAAPPVSTSHPLQEERWDRAVIESRAIVRLDKAIASFERYSSRYRTIERQRVNGVPAPVVFALHGRESAWNFSRHLHEGSPLSGRTRNVPKGRPLRPDPPYTFEQSAEDALYVLKRLDLVRWNSRGDSLQAVEAYNGLGYQKYHPEVPSPYLWSGTSLYKRGKYVADGRFSAVAVDKQLGCAAIFKRMRERGMALSF